MCDTPLNIIIKLEQASIESVFADGPSIYTYTFSLSNSLVECQ